MGSFSRLELETPATRNATLISLTRVQTRLLDQSSQSVKETSSDLRARGWSIELRVRAPTHELQ